MKNLNHKNVVQIIDIFFDNKEGVYYSVMEYAKNGDLFEKFTGDGAKNIDEEEVKHIIHTILSALNYFKHNGIVSCYSYDSIFVRFMEVLSQIIFL